MFDEIFTYSQSISSSCKNSLVSARKGKWGSRAHIELSYFVSFFSTPAHSFHLITSPPPLKFLVFFVVPSFLVHACLCFFPGKHHWSSGLGGRWWKSLCWLFCGRALCFDWKWTLMWDRGGKNITGRHPLQNLQEHDNYQDCYRHFSLFNKSAYWWLCTI